jgi:hypothetical protein
MKGDTYNFTTLAQIAEVINEENSDTLLSDLCGCLTYAIAAKKMFPDMKLTTMTWVDDGEKGITGLSCIHHGTGKILTFKMEDNKTA